jgi:GWxTD domain-containing protein
LWLKSKLQATSLLQSVAKSAVQRSAFNVSFMTKYFSIVLLFFCCSSYAQPLRDINYEYLYNPDATVSFELRPVVGEESYTILYSLEVKDTVGLMNQYTVEWEGRSLLSDKEGTRLALEDVVTTRNKNGFSGWGTVAIAGAPKYIVARVTNNTMMRAWLFYTVLDPDYPVNGSFTHSGSPVTKSFIRTREPLSLADKVDTWVVSYYNDNFPPAAPVFSEAQARVSPVISSDSVYEVSADETITFSRKGLYLLQKDTTSLKGFAVRAEEDYPQYSRLASLTGPLIYISTRQEYERLAGSDGNKKAFDRVILSIAGQTDRARILMRNYFRRVELANRYFTSYKEGWKTDRGMAYIVFGKPDQVYRFSDREVWNYDNSRFKIRFNFSRSTSLFDPDNFVLIREKKYESTWYEVVDLWRNARF